MEKTHAYQKKKKKICTKNHYKNVNKTKTKMFTKLINKICKNEKVPERYQLFCI